jgi:hypothetical protein
MIAHSASNCVADLSIGIDKDFFRSLLRMAVRWLPSPVGLNGTAMRQHADGREPVLLSE